MCESRTDAACARAEGWKRRALYEESRKLEVQRRLIELRASLDDVLFAGGCVRTEEVLEEHPMAARPPGSPTLAANAALRIVDFSEQAESPPDAVAG